MRPLLLTVVLGCGVSLLVSGRLTLRLIADGAISFAFVPICQIAGFACVWRRTPLQALSFAEAVDRFFAGNAPWLWWFVALGAASMFSWPIWWHPARLELSTLPPIAWSAYIDIRLFRSSRAFILQRAISWSLAVLYFFGFVLWGELAGRLP